MLQLTRPRAVIFDMDGLLLDSERVALRFFEQAATELGAPWSAEVGLSMVGLNSRDSNGLILKAFGDDFPIDALRERFGELYEAAEIDGASRWQILRHVTIPVIMPTITICIFLTLSSSFKLFDQNLALTNGAPQSKTEMVALNIVNTMFARVGQEGVGQAKAVIFVIIVVAVAFLQLRATRTKEVEA